MKRLFYLISFAFIAITQANASSIYMRFVNPASYHVNIDGYYYEVNGFDFRIPSLTAGYHSIIIESYAACRNPRQRAMPVVVYNGQLRINAYSDLFATIDGYGFHIDREVSHRYGKGYKKQYHYRYNSRDNRYDEADGDECNEYYSDNYPTIEYHNNNRENREYRDNDRRENRDNDRRENRRDNDRRDDHRSNDRGDNRENNHNENGGRHH